MLKLPQTRYFFKRIPINGLNINQINTLQTNLDILVNSKVQKTVLATSLTTLAIKVGAPTDLATVSIKGDTLQDTLTLASTKGILLTQFGAGTNGDVYLRPNLATGLVSICDNSTSKKS